MAGTAAELHLQTIATLNQEITRSRQQNQALAAEVQRLKEENKRLKDAAEAPSLPPEKAPGIRADEVDRSVERGGEKYKLREGEVPRA